MGYWSIICPIKNVYQLLLKQMFSMEFIFVCNLLSIFFFPSCAQLWWLIFFFILCRFLLKFFIDLNSKYYSNFLTFWWLTGGWFYIQWWRKSDRFAWWPRTFQNEPSRTFGGYMSPVRIYDIYAKGASVKFRIFSFLFWLNFPGFGLCFTPFIMV